MLSIFFLKSFFIKRGFSVNYNFYKGLLPLMLLVFSFAFTTNGYSQKISLDVKNKPVQQVFKEIESQSNYFFI
jgi:hypothetical protein